MEVNESKVVGNALDEAGSLDQDTGKKEAVQVVDYKSFDKAVGQLKKLKDEKNQLLEKIANFENERKLKEETELTEQGQYKKLLEIREKEINDLRSEVNNARGEKDQLKKVLSDGEKLQAVFDKLPGRLTNPKYMDFIDVDSIVIDPETNRIDEQSVDIVVNAFMEEHKSLVDTSHVGRLPANAAGQGQMPLHKRFKDLSLSEMRKNIATAVRQAKKEQGVL